MKGSTFKRCGCTDEAGRQLRSQCPKLANRRHGTFGYADRIDTSTGRRLLQRLGFATRADAEHALTHVHDLVKLAGADVAARQRIGDLIVEKTRDRGQLPAVEDIAGGSVSAGTWTGRRPSAKPGRYGWRARRSCGPAPATATSRSAGTGCCPCWRTWP